MKNPRNPHNEDIWIRKTEVAYFKDRILLKYGGIVRRQDWDTVSKFFLDLRKTGNYREQIKNTLYVYEVIKAKSPTAFVQAN